MTLQVVSSFNPEFQHLVVAPNGALSIQEGSVEKSFGYDWCSKVFLGMGLSTDAPRLQRNVSEVASLNSKLAEELLNLHPVNLPDVISLAKHVNETGKTANISCSACCIDFVRSDAVHNYNDLIEEANDLSTRYFNLFNVLKNFGASDDEICKIIKLFARHDETLVSRPNEFVSTEDFVKGLRKIAGDRLFLSTWADQQIDAVQAKLSKLDEQLKSFEIPDQNAAMLERKLAGYIHFLRPIAQIKFQGKLVTQASLLDYLKRCAANPDNTVKQTALKECEKLLLCQNPDEQENTFNQLMKEAKELSDIFWRTLLVLSPEDRIKRLHPILEGSYLGTLFYVLPMMYRCCVSICGEEKAFENGTMQSRWKDMYHEFRASVCDVLRDPSLEFLQKTDQRFSTYLNRHDNLRDIWFNNS